MLFRHNRSCLWLLGLSVLLPCSLEAAAASHYFSGGGRVPLHPSPRYLAVRPLPGSSPDLPTLLPGMIEAGRERELVLHRLRLVELRDGLDAAAVAAAREALAAYPEIDLMARVFETRDALMIVTDRFVARAAQSLTAAELADLNRHHGVEIVRGFEWDERTFVLRALRGDTLATANTYHLLPQIEYAHPDFVRVVERRPLGPPAPGERVVIAPDGRRQPDDGVIAKGNTGRLVGGPTSFSAAAGSLPGAASVSGGRLLEEGFEGAFPGSWTLVGDPTWGKVGIRYSGLYGGYCVGSSVPPPGPYPNDASALMYTGPFDLSDALDARITVQTLLNTEPEYDPFVIAASTGGDFVGPFWTGFKAGNFGLDLKRVPVLGDVTGEPQVWIGLGFTSDGTVQGEGVYVDEIVVEKITGGYRSLTSDEYDHLQWGLANNGQLWGVDGADIQVEEAWAVSHGSPAVTVAIIDEGVDLSHPDLAAKLVAGYDATGLGSGGGPLAGDAQGTACAGIAAASTDNSIGVAGIARAASLMPVRVAYDGGSGWVTSDSWLADGINWAANNGADVLSNSWGGGTPSAIVDDAIDNARTNGRGGKGAVVVFGAGNDNGPVAYPATNPGVVAVGALSPCDTRKSPTSCDADHRWGSNFGPELDLLAPGVHIYTTDITGATGYDAGDYFFDFNGTSSAAPVVAGVAALLLGHQPDLTADEAVRRLVLLADDLGPPGPDDETGYGRVNAYRSLWLPTPPLFEVELVNSTYDTGDGELAESEGTHFDLTELLVTFTSDAYDPPGDGEANDVTNPASYGLFADGPDGVFQSDACGAAQGDDVAISVGPASYDAPTRTVTLGVNGGLELNTDRYRLLVCPTLHDVWRQPLDGDGSGGAFARHFEFRRLLLAGIRILDCDGKTGAELRLRGTFERKVYNLQGKDDIGDPFKVIKTGLGGVVGDLLYVDCPFGAGRDHLSQFYRFAYAGDDDGDQAPADFEINYLGTDYTTADTDGDGVLDGDEDELDGDGKTNAQEYNGLGTAAYDPCVQGTSDPAVADTDADGVSDGPLDPDGGGPIAPGPDAFPLDPAGWYDPDCDGRPNHELAGPSNSDPPLVEDDRFVLAVALAGSGGGTVQGPGIDCGGDCEELLFDATVVTLVATPAPGSLFAGWSRAGCEDAGSACSFTLTRAEVVTATFETWQVACPAGMIGYWDLDDQSDPGRDVLGSSPGVLSGDAVWEAAGIRGGALHFDDWGKVQIPRDRFGGILGTQPFTVVAWTQADDICLLCAEDYDRLVNRGWSSPGAWLLMRNKDSFGFYFKPAAGGPWTVASFADGFAGVEIVAGRWYFVAGVSDGERVTIYVDGIRGETVPILGTVNQLDVDLEISDVQYSPDGVDGYVDEVAIFDRALSDCRIEALYQTVLAGGGYCSSNLEALCPGCELPDVDLVLHQTTLDTPRVHFACRSIMAGPELTVDEPVGVILRAGHQVAFAEGFSVLSDSRLLVMLAPTLAGEAPACPCFERRDLAWRFEPAPGGAWACADRSYVTVIWDHTGVLEHQADSSDSSDRCGYGETAIPTWIHYDALTATQHEACRTTLRDWFAEPGVCSFIQ